MVYRNYLKLAVRNLTNSKLFSVLNITGLTVGLTVSSFISLHVWHEFHYDRFQALSSRTWRVNSVADFGGDQVRMSQFHQTYGTELQKQISGIERMMRYNAGFNNSVLLQSDTDHKFRENRIGFADENALSIMGCTAVNGSLVRALQDPGKIVLLTITIQTVRAALTNPIRSLRRE